MKQPAWMSRQWSMSILLSLLSSKHSNRLLIMKFRVYVAAIGLMVCLQPAAADCPNEQGDLAQTIDQLSIQKPPIKIKRFNVKGVSGDEVRDYLDDHGPADIYGKKVDAKTDWKITWAWPNNSAG